MDKITEAAGEKIKIAQVIGNAKTGGVVSCVMNFFRNVDRDRFQFDFYTYGPSPYDAEIKSLGGRVFYFPNVLKFFKSVRFLKKKFIQENYYAVHAHLTTLSFVPLFAAKLARVKFRVCHAHSTGHKSEKVWLVKQTLKHISRLFPTHLAGCSELSNCYLYGKKHGKDAFLLRNAIDLDKFSFNKEHAAAVRERYGLSNSQIVGAVGRFEFQKNYPFLIDAFAMLRFKKPNAKLVLVGGGSEIEKIEEKIAFYKLEEYVKIVPNNNYVQDFFGAFDLFVMPSRFEGLPLVAIEAQAMGVPVLLSSYITEETDITEKCEFMPIDSAGAWADKMSDMLDNAKRYDARQAIEDAGYDIKKETKRLEEFYLSLAKRNWR